MIPKYKPGNDREQMRQQADADLRILNGEGCTALEQARYYGLATIEAGLRGTAESGRSPEQWSAPPADIYWLLRLSRRVRCRKKPGARSRNVAL